ncbi:hypothetical protein GINT2_000763 [Glugoides intestinalis]
MSTVDTALLPRIKMILTSKKITPTPKSITNACFEAIVELARRKNFDFKELVDIAVQQRAFELNKLSLEVLELCLDKYSAAMCNLLKVWFKETPSTCVISNERLYEYKLFQVLLKHANIQGVSNLISKNFDIAEYFKNCDLDKQVALLLNSMSILRDVVDALQFVEIQTALEPEILNKLLLVFLEVKSQHEEEVNNDCLNRIIKLIHPELPQNLTILILILTFYRRNMLRATANNAEFKSIFQPKFIQLIRHEILEAEHPEQAISELVSLLSKDFLPSFTSLIVELNNNFISQKKNQRILQNIISYIGIQNFISIIDHVDIAKHAALFKVLSNIDLSVFIGLYHFYSQGTDFEIPTLDYSRSEPIECILSDTAENCIGYLLGCLPSFCYYCTDIYENCHSLIKIFNTIIKTRPSIINSALEKLLQSHINSLSNNLVLVNPITMEESEKILEAVKSSGLAHSLMEMFIENTNFECEDTLNLLLPLCEIDLSNDLIPIIMEEQVNPNITVCSALRLMVFFVRKHRYDFDFINRILELCSSQVPDLQKKAYLLLYHIYTNRLTDVCICDILYSTLCRTVGLPAERNRIMVLYAILRNGCVNCQLEDKTEIFKKFIYETVVGFTKGNYKCKKLVKEIVIDMVDDQFFIDYLEAYTSPSNTDEMLLSGCISAIYVLLDHISNNLGYIDINCSDEGRERTTEKLHKLFSLLLSVGKHSQKTSKQLLEIFAFFIKHPQFMIFHQEILKLVDAYINQFSKKLNADLRKFCVCAKNNDLPLTRSMKTLLKFRNKGGVSKDIQVVEKRDFNTLL